MSVTRDPDITRQKILDVCAEEMHLCGYKAASLAEILKKAGISKGALYHHFGNKQELGYAVFEEVYVQDFLQRWQEVLRHPDPVTGISRMLEDMIQNMTDEEICTGCPVNTISQEMSTQDEGFRLRTVAMYKRAEDMIAAAFSDAVEQGLVRRDLNCHSAALFILACFQGAASLVKSTRDLNVLRQLNQGLQDYLATLRP